MISASIVSYKNKPDVLARTIESYLLATNDSKLYVIDNSPTDDARSICRDPRIRYTFNPSNTGYGRAHNLAIQDSIHNSKYHLVLNPDVSFERHVVQELVAFMEKNNDVGLIMPKVLYPDGRLQPLCKLLPEPQKLFARKFLPSFKKTVERINHEYEMRFTNYDEITEVPFLSGCFMLLRNAALQTVGLFDERFFLYFEDTDLSRRIHQHYRTVFYPNVTIEHLHERKPYKRLKLLWHHINSTLYYFNKWGWFIDRERDTINRKILTKHRVNGYQKYFSVTRTNDNANTENNTFFEYGLRSPETGVIRTILYFDIFRYPLTLDEIMRFHPSQEKPEVITNAISHLRNKLIVFKHDNFYSLHPGAVFVQRRKKGNALARKRLQTAKNFSRLISTFPFIRAIMLSGSLSKDYMEKNSDIDYFIITEPGRLWLTRGMLALFKRVFLLNSHKFFCTNYLIDSESLEIEEKNIYTAIETATLVPVYGRDLYAKFVAKNQWTKRHLPNFELHRTAFISEKVIPIKKIFEWIFTGTLGEKLDLLFMRLATKRWKKKFSDSFTPADFELAFKSSRNISKNHPRFFQKKILNHFQEKIDQFEVLNEKKLST